MAEIVGDWFRPGVDRKTLKELMRRSDLVPLTRLAGFLGALAASGWVSYAYWGTLPGALAFIVYGAIYGFIESLRHETHHRTAFRSPAINAAVHWLAGFMGVNEPLSDRWLHTKHHSHTYRTGIDPEIQTPRPPNLVLIALDLFRLRSLPAKLSRIVSLASGRFEPVLAAEVPEAERPAIVWSARAMLAGYAAIILASAALQSWMPLVYTFGARMSGAWLHMLAAYTQHAGLPENVDDFRVNTRTIISNPILRFLYWNMNYHIEHHMFPLVPFYHLPKLHRLIKDDLPAPYRGFPDAWLEIVPVLIAQRRDPNIFIRRGPLQEH
ncbi:MAG: fatty acid desaturase [Proteobacteria bacterium]|nr:fatty acid desaturase [Pseudomonadota bacterium]MBI3496604.1 fatty acid desaturase [Pseudomonadota bacterium]